MILYAFTNMGYRSSGKYRLTDIFQLSSISLSL